MDDRSLKFLEFYHLLDILKKYSISPLGRKRCEALRPSKNLSLIRSRLTEVMALKEILETEGEIPLGGVKDIEEIFNKSSDRIVQGASAVFSKVGASQGCSSSGENLQTF
jgi:DNA mismatch repair protein MutS2